MVVRDVMRLNQNRRALGPRVSDALVDVPDVHGQIHHAVTVPAVLVEQW